MLTKNHTHHLLFLLTGFLLLVACQPQPPILVYITPTHDEVASASTAVPTIEASVAATENTPSLQSATAVPTETVPPQPTQPLGPTQTFEGAVIAPGYTLPPTSTPRPTNTQPPPPPSATPVPGATQAPAAQPTNPPAAAPQGALPNLDANMMGIQLDPTLNQTDWNNAIGDIHNLGVKWLKVQVSWKQLQPNAAGEIGEDFRRLEIYLETAFNSGLDILISIAKAPNWARSNQNEDGPPDDPQALVDFLNVFLREVGPSIDAVEIWNEPNLSREWQGLPLNGQSYMKYFVPAYNAAKQYAESMKTDTNAPRNFPLYVITAGLAPTGQSDGSQDDREYLKQMYSAGLAQYTDAYVGIHPYGWGNAPDDTCCHMSQDRGWDDNRKFFFMDNVQDYRDIMVQSGDTQGKMWATEFGWATWAGFPGEPPQPWMAYVDECQQGNDIIRAFQIGQSLDYMGPMILWNLNFAVLSGLVENRDERAAYSLITPLNPRERAGYWMIYDAVRPNQQLQSYSRCPGPG